VKRTVPALLPFLFLWSLAGCDSSPTEAGTELLDECTAELALPALGVGEGMGVTGSTLQLLCLSPDPSEPAEYVLVLHSASEAPRDTLRLNLRSTGLRPPGAEPGPLASAPQSGPEASLVAPYAETSHTHAHSTTPHLDHEHHLELRQMEERELAPRLRPGTAAWPTPPTARASHLPEVGTLLEFNARARSPACQQPIYRSGQVEAVSSRAIVVADTLNPGSGFTRSDYEGFAAAFDTLVAPLTEQAFGAPSDIDGNGRVILFFTQEVNRLTEADSDTFVGGFFFARDLFPRVETERFQACPHSNEAEILYLMVPDPSGTIGGNVRSVDFVRRIALATLAHEQQHLINAARRLHIVQSPSPFEEVWLNEGLSHLAEELLFYRASGLSPGQNLDVPTLQQAGSRAIEAINRHQLANAQRFRQYIERPHASSPYSDQDLLTTRGAAWHFLRYAADRRGGSQTQLFRQLVDAPETGLDNLAGALGGRATLHTWFSDWSVAVYADSRVPGLPDRYRERSWNHVSLFRTLDQQNGESDPPFPLAVTELPASGERTQSVSGGGSAYLRFALDEGAYGEIQITSGGAPPPAFLRGVLLRIR